MSVPYHKMILDTGKVRLFVNFSSIKEDVADESLTLHFYATDINGIPIFTEKLGLEDIRSLFKHLDSISVIKEGSKKSSKFIETTDDINLILERLKESDLEIILSLLEKFRSEEKIKGLLNSLSDLEIKNLHGAYHHNIITTELLNLENLLDLEENGNLVNEVKGHSELSKYSSGQPEKIFQNWIESNLWIFGVDYIKKHDARKIALFSEGDMLMESADGYLDLIELKRPKHELLKYDTSHNCFYPHTDLSLVIGQSLFYLQKLSEYKLILEKEYKIKVIMPRVKIIAGRNKDFEEKQRDSIRMLNSNLNSVQLITYDDLLNFGNLLLKTNEIDLKK